MRLAPIALGTSVAGLAIGGLVGTGLGVHFYLELSQSYSWLAQPAAVVSATATPTPPPPPAAIPTPTPLAESCVLWSGDGQWNLTIYGDHPDHDFPGYCAMAQRSRFAMHSAGPAAGTVTCDMTALDERFVFRDTVSRTYLPCDRATPFFQAVRGV